MAADIGTSVAMRALSSLLLDVLSAIEDGAWWEA